MCKGVVGTEPGPGSEKEGVRKGRRGILGGFLELFWGSGKMHRNTQIHIYLPEAYPGG